MITLLFLDGERLQFKEGWRLLEIREPWVRLEKEQEGKVFQKTYPASTIKYISSDEGELWPSELEEIDYDGNGKVIRRTL